jgi:hypothetical protein
MIKTFSLHPLQIRRVFHGRPSTCGVMKGFSFES